MENPSRMTKAQRKFCAAVEGRYRPVLAGATSGIIMLTDSTPGEEDDEIVVPKVPSVEDEEAPMPEEFVWHPVEGVVGVEPKEKEGGEEAKMEETE
jgi:hypothetical protein